VISDISTIPSFAAPLQKIIIDSYVISLEYSHSKLTFFLSSVSHII
jgi:hypothetical protein